MEIVESVFKLYYIALENLLPILHKKHKKSYIGAAISLVFLQRVYSYFRAPKHLRHMPIIPYFPMVKSLLNHELAYSRFKRLILPAIRENNGIYVSKVPLDWTVYIANPMIAKYVLFHTDTYPKSHDMLTNLGSDSPLVQLIGYDNILISNGHLWKNQRKLVNPAFHRSMPIKTVSSVIFDLFSAIEKENGTISIAPKMKDFTLDALGLTLFGFDFKALKGDPDEWTKVFRQGIQVAMDPFLNVLSPLYSVLSFIFPEKRRQMKAVIKLNGKMDQMIKQKHTEVLSGAYSDIPENEKDLVVLMLEAERRGEGITNDLQLRNNMALLLLAGHDTTATALSFCFYNIAKNKHVQQKLREEIIGVLGDEPVDIVPTLEQLKEMSYLNLVIQENLRLNEPLNYLIPRVAKKDMIVDDILIPKGTTINFDIYGIHHNPKYWRNPNQFIPERFAKGEEHETHEGLTWLPFGDGSRRCIGMNFSMFQQRLVLAMIIRKYEIDISKDANDHRHIAGFKTKSRGSPKLTFTKRY